MFSTLLYLLFIIIFSYCLFSVIYIFIFSLWGRFFYRGKQYANPGYSKKIAILVPAYKEDGIILSTANHLTELAYPKDAYGVYILADSFREDTVQQLRKLPVKVIEVSFEKSTKTKSLNEAFKRIDQPYDLALICDADNILARDFLEKINAAFANGVRAVQGRRVAKNLDSSFAILDACSEAINNHIFRKGANAIGLSSSVIGSGMAFEFLMIKQVLSEINAVGGFDKILQLKIVQKGIPIRYIEDAVVFDEKVESSGAFRQQRKRWVSSQFIYFKQFFIPAVRQLFRGNFSYFNIAVLSNFILPRAFLLVILPALSVVAFFVDPYWGWGTASLFFLYIVSLGMALPAALVNRDLLIAIAKLPKAIAIMFGTLLHIKRANKTFIHTVHTKTEVTNPYLRKDTPKEK
jgi:cellulose synthase/poly-beta-1,6-N-acetylglucosamine synthase-like glycosyltransferase